MPSGAQGVVWLFGRAGRIRHALVMVLVGVLLAACTAAEAPEPSASATGPSEAVQGQTGQAESARDSFAGDPPQPDGWSLGRITPDGRTIWVIRPASSCDQAGPSSVTETENTVTIDVTVLGPTPGTACESAEPLSYRLDLDNPLDDRTLDGCGRPDCWMPGPEGGVESPRPLGVDMLGVDVVVAGVVGPSPDVQGDRPIVSGVARLDTRSGGSSGPNHMNAPTRKTRWGPRSVSANRSRSG